MKINSFYGEKFAVDIRNKRKALKLTQQEAAFCLEIETRTLQYAEYGRLPDTPIFLKLCSFYGLTASDYGEKVSPSVPVHAG